MEITLKFKALNMPESDTNLVFQTFKDWIEGVQQGEFLTTKERIDFTKGYFKNLGFRRVKVDKITGSVTASRNGITFRGLYVSEISWK